ncbi:MAG: PAS domain S-box protein [Flavobacteriales bacterium]
MQVDFLSLTEAAALLKCHHNTVRAWVRQGKLEAIPMGAEKVPMYRKRDLEALKRPLEKAGVIVRDDKHAFPVVGIGASAGGLDAVSKVLATMPTDLGLAYVIVQHLEAEREPVFADLLRKKTAMPVFVAENGMRLDPDVVYVIPGGTYAAVVNTTFALRTPNEAARPIDAFFTQLAGEYQNNAIGIVLSGTGMDGTEGLRAIRAEDGLTITQDSTAQEQGMPQSAQEADVVDVVLKPEAIGPELADLVKQLYPGGEARIPGKHENEMRRILQYLYAQRGIDFTQYKEATIHRRIIRRMVLSKCRKLADYSALLHGLPSEVDTLCNDMLINVTSFFRDPLFFKALTQQVFPALLNDRVTNDSLRIWVPACAGGEEVVGIAITLLEFIGDRAVTAPVQFFCTDLNERTIEKARLGIYKKNALQNMDPELVKKYFQHVDGHYQVIKPIRDMCVFAKHDLLKDPPFSRVDLISCQNMLIYLENAAQGRVIKSFHYALKPTGFLALGKSESASVAGEIFDQPDRTFKVYTKKNTGSERLNLDVRYKPTLLQPPTVSSGALPFQLSATLADLDRDTEKLLLNRYTPASVLVSKDLSIVRFRGNTAPYLSPATGKASLNLLKMVHEDLVFELRGLLQKAKKEKGAIRKEGVPMRADDLLKRVSLEVVPVGDPREQHYLVLFKEDMQATTAPPDGRKWKNVRDERERRILQLEQDLAEAREQMRVAAEESETAQQELQSANEEVVSSNEELQSINEELETSKEELQSINEEFATINEELQTRNESLLESEERYRQLIHLMPVAVFVCDSQGRITIYNERAAELWGRVPDQREGQWNGAYRLYSAAGDLLAHDEAPMARAIKEGLAMINEELIVERPDGTRRRVLVNPTPLLDSKGRPSGAINVLVDITEHKKADEQLREMRVRLDLALDSAELGTWNIDGRVEHMTVDERFKAIFGWAGDTITVAQAFSVLHPDDREPTRVAIEGATRPVDTLPYEVEYRVVHPDGSIHWVLARGRSIFTDAEQGRELLSFNGTVMDITARRAAEDALRMSEQRYHVLADNLPQMIYIGDLTGKAIWVNDRWVEFTGLSSEDVIAGKWAEAVHPDDAGPMMESYMQCFAKEQDWEFTFRIKNKQGQYRWFLSRCSPLRGENGEVLRWFGTNTDITETKRAEEVLRSQAERQTFMVRLGDALRPLLDPVEVQAEASRLLAEQLGADRVAYFTIKDEQYIVERDHAVGVPSVVGGYPVAAFGDKLLATYLSGITGLSDDVRRDPNFTSAQIEAYDALQLRAFIGVPLVKDGTLVGGLSIHSAQPRSWTAEEIAIAEETAERIWASVERTQAGAAMRSSEQRYRMLFTTMEQGFCVVEIVDDENGNAIDYRFVEVNQAFETHTGLSNAAGKTIRELVPDIEPIWTERYARVARTGEAARFEDHAPSMDRWFDIYVYPMKHAPGRVGILFSNVSERKRAERELATSEERFRLLSDNIAQLAWIAEPDGAIHWYNKRWFEFTGTTLEDMRGWGWQKIHHPEHVDHVAAKFKHHIENGIDWQDTFPILGADGKYHWFLSRAFPVRDEKGTILRWFGTNTDVTELREAEERLRESEVNFRMLADNMDQLAMITDADGKAEWFNKRWQTALGVDFASLSREERLSWMHPDDVERMWNAFRNGLASGKPWDATFRMRVSSGEYRWFLTRSVPVAGHEGEVLRWFTTNTDITEAKQAAQVVQDRQDRLMSAAEAAELGVFMWHIHKDEPSWENDRMFAIFGRTREEGPLTSAAFEREAVHPEDLPGLREKVAGAVAEVGAFDHVFRIHRPGEKQPRVLQVTAQVQQTSGTPDRIVGVMADITDRETDAEAARRLAAIVASTHDAVISKDLNGIITSWNQAATEVFGYTAEETVGRSILMLIPEELQGEEATILARLRKGERIEHYETVRQRKDGTRIEVALTVSPIITNEGVVIGASKVARDISERKRLQQDITTANEQLRMVTYHMPVAVARVGRDQRFMWASQGYLEWIGLAEARVEGKQLREVLGEEAHAALLPYMEQVLKGEPVECEVHVELPTRGKRWLDVKYAPLYEGENIPSGWIEVITDITEQKQTEEALEESSKHKDHFLATLAHELRNPLAPLKNGLQLMELAPDDPSVMESTRAMMTRQLDHMVRLVDDLMDLSRISRGKIELEREPVGLNGIVAMAIEASKPHIENKGHQLEVDMGHADNIVNGDAARLTQVVANLLNNAAKYTLQGGRISIAVGRRGDEAEIRVKDNGIGIEPAFLSHVFDMFAQVDPSQKTQAGGGLGIGLNIVQRLVNMHGGTVEGRSEGSGRGSEFIVRLPVLPSIQRPAAAPSSKTRPEVPSRRLLVVDDNHDAALSMSMILKKRGHLVQVANDGEQALAVGATFHPEVVLMDIGMPRMNGYEACARMRTSDWGKDALIIALTGWGQEEDRRRSQEAGFDNHLVKPIETGTLERMIASVK